LTFLTSCASTRPRHHLPPNALSPTVCEGLCELFGYLWLRRQAEAEAAAGLGGAAGAGSGGGGAGGRSNGSGGGGNSPVSSGGVQRGSGGGDAAVFLELHRKNEDPVYGGGFREALAALDRCGGDAAKLVAFVEANRAFPKK